MQIILQIKPILAALRRHKAGTVLIALQIALTLAIVCNALFIIQQRLSQLSRPSGADEAHLFVIENQWVSQDADTYGARMSSDLATLRRVPGVADAYTTNMVPLGNSGYAHSVDLKPNQRQGTQNVAYYFAGSHALATLGLELVAGRNFHADEIHDLSANDKPHPAVIIITRALAKKLFPHGSALGKRVYIYETPSTIIGVVKRLQVPWATSTYWSTKPENSALLPVRQLNKGTSYVVRVRRPGQLDRVMRAAPKALDTADRMRVIPDKYGVQSFAQLRADAYASDRGMAIMMGVICAVLLTITAAGIVGLTSFWVGQRRKQIGVRRALGATRRDILGYFLTENALIAIGGVVLGTALALGLNQWLMQVFEMQRLSPVYIAIGIIVLLALGQAAVLVPALRAARVPPVEATRTV